MIILDTNVLSGVMRATPDPALLHWLDNQPASSLWTTSFTILEIRFGLQIMPEGRRRQTMTRSFEVMMESKLEDRVADFDSAAAECAADLMAFQKTKGRPIELKDTLIAGIVLSRHAVLATRNTTNFSDLGSSVVNPWSP